MCVPLFPPPPTCPLQSCLAKAPPPPRPGTRRNHQRPQYRGCNNTNRPHGSLVHPFLLANHRQYPTAGTLYKHTQGRLQTYQSLKITALLQLYHYLLIVANLLYLVPLAAVEILEVRRKMLDIYIIPILKSCIHSSSSY